MTRSKWFLHQGRPFEVRDVRVVTSFQIWVYENERPLAQHSAVPLSDVIAGAALGKDVLNGAMEVAVRDVQAGRFRTAPSSMAG
jgi:hypothetical protein